MDYNSFKLMMEVYRKAIRRLRLIRINRNFIVFLVFLVISIGFWFLQALKEPTTTTLEYKVHITNVPKGVVFTSDVPETVSISVTGRGWSILQYLSQHENKEINIDFSELNQSRSRITLDANVWRRHLTKELGNALKFNSSIPSTAVVYFSYGQTKRVPVVFNGKVTTEMQHVLGDIILKPDSVDVVAPTYLLDSIQSVQTSYQSYLSIEDTIHKKIRLQALTGVKILPDSINVTVCVDLFTEKTIEVPIYCENIPNNKVLRTFPSKANITFHVSATHFNSVKANDFIVVVDYNDVTSGEATCKLQLRAKPKNVSHVRVSPVEVEYLIEQSNE